MSLSLNTIQSNNESSRKRLGRGNSSGKGTYCGKGQKGQRARAGVSNLKRLGMKQVLLRIPKSRGFKSLQPDNQVVNLREINKYFQDGETVSPQTLADKGLTHANGAPVKILGDGELKLKDLKFQDVKMSDSAAEKIKKQGK